MERSIGETRAVAVDGNDVPFALYIERASDAGRRVRVGEVFVGRVRAVAPQQGALFVELPSGIEVVMRPVASAPLTEGAAVTAKIVSEAYRDKRARAVVCASEHAEPTGIARWQSALPDGNQLIIEDVKPGHETVEEAFAAAIDPHVVLPGGGRLTLSSTPALLAVDIDTTGRGDKGRAASRALNINRAAATALAREISLRQFGGLLVLDCIAPMNRDSSEQVREAFLLAIKRVSKRATRCLRPSSLGLMEMSIERVEVPIPDLLLDANGALTPETECLNALRALEREARIHSMGSLMLHLPVLAKDWFDHCGMNLQQTIDQAFGARISVVESHATKFEISSQ